MGYRGQFHYVARRGGYHSRLIRDSPVELGISVCIAQVIATDEANVVIVGIADQVRSAGYWKQALSRNKDFSDDELACYLAIVNFVSSVFSEETPASTRAEALAVLNGKGEAMEPVLDRQLLAALLNFVNGSVAWDQLIDTDGDSVGDTAFSDVIVNAEAIRLNPTSTRAELEAQKDLLEDINLGDA